MIKANFPIEKLKAIETPCYYYDIDLLKETLKKVKEEAEKYDYLIHYAIKANANPRILSLIAEQGLGADCVSGGEIQAALNAGFPPQKIVFAGVGKDDWEIALGLDHNIACFNVESEAELNVIQEIASNKGKIANVALRINPEIDAHTHAKITTGMKENKFGINIGLLNDALSELTKFKHVKLIGMHFHIGSQITDLSCFENLAIRANEIQDVLAMQDVQFETVNFGGGLGIDYHHPNEFPIASFESFFSTINRHFVRRKGQMVRFEPGRSIVGPCGTLIARTIYVKEGETKNFVVLNAGFTDLMRPAMYNAYHHMENITSNEEPEVYDVVGPICESSDVFGLKVELNRVRRGDLIAIRSAGAYGEVMASQYNCRKLPRSCFSDTL